jgi:hypothetical protein
VFCEGRIPGARHWRGSVWCRGRPALRRTVRGVGAGSSSSYSSRWRPRTCRGTWMATVTTPAALRFLLCLGLITVRTDSSPTEPDVPIWVVSSVVCWVAIGFELSRCLDLLLILCLSDDLDTDSSLGSELLVVSYTCLLL